MVIFDWNSHIQIHFASSVDLIHNAISIVCNRSKAHIETRLKYFSINTYESVSHNNDSYKIYLQLLSWFTDFFPLDMNALIAVNITVHRVRTFCWTSGYYFVDPWPKMLKTKNRLHLSIDAIKSTRHFFPRTKIRSTRILDSKILSRKIYWNLTLLK